MSERKEVVRWADKAMFEAEPVKDSGPRVYLLSMTPDPLGTIAAANLMYSGRVVRDLKDITHEERLHEFEQLMKTALKAPFEFVKFNFLIEGVTRAFTHQMVRIRQATFVQESMRFAVKTDMPVALPPSLAGTIYHGRGQDYDDTFERLSPDNQKRIIWEETMETVEDAYNRLINMGMPAEEARGLAPTDVLTRIHLSIDLHALLNHSGYRLCTQAQFEWRLVFSEIVKTIRNGFQRDYRYLNATREIEPRSEIFYGNLQKIIQEYQVLSRVFAPICYQTGKCEFMSEVDRACSIRDRVQANHAIGRTSEHWGQPKLGEWSDPSKELGDLDMIAAIHPAEWLLDPTAARVR